MYTDLDPRCDMQPHLPRLLNRDVYYKGDIIIQQGSTGINAYYIEQGRVEILVREGPHEVKIAELGPGEIFGEMALIEHETRSAAVRAITDTTVTVISASELQKKIKRIEDKAVGTLIHVFIDRLRTANNGQLARYKELADFQDRVTGIITKAGRGIDKGKRDAFRDEAEPLLAKLEALLEKYHRR